MQTRQLAELLRRDGFSVELVPVNRPYRPRWVARVPVVRAFFRLLPYLAALLRAAGRNDLLHLMANSGWSWHLFATPAILVARIRRLPIVINYRGGSAPEFLARQGRWVLPFLRRANVLAVPSGFLAEVFQPYGLNATIVPNIVDLQRFLGAAEARADSGRPLHVVVTRNLEPIYDIATALRAFALIRQSRPDGRMRVAGSGPERDRLMEEARKLGVDEAVEFTGRLDADAMARLYRTADIMLNPSLVDNTPNSILEAWASGVAVVSTRVGGVPHLVAEGRDAILVPAGDPGAMADAVIGLVNDPERLRLLREEGERSARRFAWDQVKPIWLRVYRDAAGSSASNSRGRTV